MSSCVTLTHNLSFEMHDAAVGGDVSRLQRFLARNSGIYPEGTIDGYFGIPTQLAVARWQKAHGIISAGTPQTTGWGAVGPKTRAAMAVCTAVPRAAAPAPANTSAPKSSTASNPAPVSLPPPTYGPTLPLQCITLTRTLSFGSRGSDVTMLQNFLASAYSNFPTPTGYFGATTEAAVRRWQKEHGLISFGTPATTGYGVVGPKTRAAIAMGCAPGTASAQSPQTQSQTYSSTPTQTTQVQQTNTVQTQTQTQQTQTNTDPAFVAWPTSGAAPDSCALNGTTVADGASKTFYSDASIAYGGSCANYAQSRSCSNGTLSGDASYQYSSCAVGDPNACSFNNQGVANGASVTAYQAATVAYGSQCVSQSRKCSNGSLSGSYQYPACVAGAASSCTFNGQTVAHGASVTAYQGSAVPFGQQCVSQSRMCTNGTLSESFANVTCTATARPSSALPIFIDGGWNDFTNLPSYYEGFINSSYLPIAFTQAAQRPFPFKAFYLSVGDVPLYTCAICPVQPSNLTAAPEDTFLHASDPASFKVYSDPFSPQGTFRIIWSRSTEQVTPDSYAVYVSKQPPSFSKPVGQLGHWWDSLSWQAATGAQEGYDYPSFLLERYTIANTPALASADSSVYCFMVKKTTSGVEQLYSYPLCYSYATAPALASESLFWQGVQKVSQQQIDQYQAVVTYNIEAITANIPPPPPVSNISLVAYEKTGGGVIAGAQTFGDLKEVGHVDLSYNASDRWYAGTLSINRPYVANVLSVDRYIPDLIYRIRVTANGATSDWPSSTTYYTSGVNNRILDRLWYGQVVNPGSPSWQALAGQAIRKYMNAGYNAVFLDNWWASYVDGDYVEAPSIELDPNGPPGEYPLAVTRFQNYLHATFPGITIIGNNISDPASTVEQQELATADGAMIEGCFVYGNPITGDAWRKQFLAGQAAIQSGKKVLCLPYYYLQSNNINGLDPINRLYGLASALLLKTADGRMLYGPYELLQLYAPNAGPDVNYLPEYQINIGDPKGNATEITPNVWYRPFSGGFVVVNAGTTSYTYTTTQQSQRIVITGANTSSSQPGTITTQDMPYGTPVSLNPGEAAIWVTPVSA